MSEPFWCEDLGKFLKVIPNEEADRICMDVQLYCKHVHREASWRSDVDPETYRNNRRIQPPSNYPRFTHAIEVDADKPEYESP